MAIDDNGPAPPGTMSDPRNAADSLFKQTSKYNYYGNNNIFKAQIISTPRGIAGEAALAVGGGKDAQNPAGLYICNVRFIEPNMAHRKFINDPCDVAIAADTAAVTQLNALHTRVTIPLQAGEVLPGQNDVIEVALEAGTNNAPFDLQIAKYIKISEINTAASNQPEEAGCVDLSLMFDNMPGGGGLGDKRDPGYCSWSGGAKAYTTTWQSSKYPTWNGKEMKNGLLEDTGMIVSDEKSGARLVPPAMDDFRKLAAAYEAKFPGKVLKGSGYRPYSMQVYARMKRVTPGNPCGKGQHNAQGGFVGYAATPGRSNHGWGAAVDIDRTSSGWTNGKKGNSPEFRWLNKYGSQFNFVFGVTNEHWHIDWMPFSAQTTGGIAATAQAPWTTKGVNDTTITFTA